MGTVHLYNFDKEQLSLEKPIKYSFLRLFTILLLGLLPIVILAQEETSKPSQQRLKVISYNIWNGFDYGKDKERQQNAIDWIKAQNPDVVALQELNDYTLEKLLHDAKKWGHSHAEILKSDGYPVGITSNKPITVKERILENMHHGALHCETWGIDFFVIHFSPFSFTKRHEEADIILSKLEKVRKNQDKYIVLGDFNALSPFDAQFYKGNNKMLAAMKESEHKHEHIRNLHMGRLEYGVMARYVGFPLLDVVQIHTRELEERLSSPSQIFEKDVDKGRYGHPKRIDYIMTSPALEGVCTYARVHNGESTYHLSDHYPVIAVFLLGD
ncbi:endonuclease/exonuclease/phosphatase family protein [Ulvibacterium sp.]|uniref:endonuclease/exonuclease/phosphatase family protein n=1 Tax=Ulvibacterium sp. TaxID=2665914 RepID=UPI002623A9BA|nr:endonuclease/exonuclease/phosphatase family protein [Ulvibacterium sp.]